MAVLIGHSAGNPGLFRTPGLRWRDLYSEAELLKAALRVYTKPLFTWRKALSTSSDDQTLYDFARRGLANLDRVHRRLEGERFQYRPGIVLHRNFNGKHRDLFIYPWEERIVDMLLYRLLNQALDPQLSSSSFAYRFRGFGVDRCQRRVGFWLRRGGGPVHVLKRDISNFFASISHEVMLSQLAQFVEPGDYLMELLSQRVRFSYLDGGRLTDAHQGVPFGTAVACLLANIHLTPLDLRLSGIPGLTYLRYADDVLALSRSAEPVARAALEYGEELENLALTSKASHTLTGELRSKGASPGAFRYLGLEFRTDGMVRLSRDKLRKIRNRFRFAFRRNRGRFNRIKDPFKRARLAVEIARRVIEDGIRNIALIDYYLKHVDDEEQLRLLDRWLAEEVLSLAFGGGHRRSHFRRLPFRKLREMGLPSLVHRRRLLEHGHLQSTFFIWKEQQRSRGFRGTAARVPE